MKVDFTKMRAGESDYAVIFFENGLPEEPKQFFKAFSNAFTESERMIVVSRSKTADAEMQLYSFNGTEIMPCVNSLSCIGKYIYEKRISDSPTPVVKTMDGLKRLLLRIDADRIKTVTVCLGNASFPDSDGFCQTVRLCGEHKFAFCDDLSQVPCELADAKIGLIKVNGRRSLLFYQTGNEENSCFSCGNEICAAVALAVKNGFVDPDIPIFASSKSGGVIVVCTSGYNLYATGSADFISHGTFDTKD